MGDVEAAPAIPQAIEDALDDDLNTPQALAEIAAIAAAARKAGDDGGRARLKSQLLGAGQALGLLQQAPADWFGRGSSGDDDARIQALIEIGRASRRARVCQYVWHSVVAAALKKKKKNTPTRLIYNKHKTTL